MINIQLSVRFIYLFGFQWTFLQAFCLLGGDDGIRLSRELRAQSFAALTVINCHSLPLLLRIPSDMGLKASLSWRFRDVLRPMVEMMGFEPMTPCLQGRCSPSWATPPYKWFVVFSVFLSVKKVVGPSGLEPPTSCLSGTRSNLLSYEPLGYCVVPLGWNLFEVSLVTFLFKESNWWRWWDSNPWPPACRAGALPAELHPHINGS